MMAIIVLIVWYFMILCVFTVTTFVTVDFSQFRNFINGHNFRDRRLLAMICVINDLCCAFIPSIYHLLCDYCDILPSCTV